MLGRKSHVSIVSLLGILLDMVIEILSHECGPAKPKFAIFAILCYLPNTIPPWGKGRGQDGSRILVAYDQGLITLSLGICSPGTTGNIEHTAIAISYSFACFVFLSPIA